MGHDFPSCPYSLFTIILKTPFSFPLQTNTELLAYLSGPRIHIFSGQIALVAVQEGSLSCLLCSREVQPSQFAQKITINCT